MARLNFYCCLNIYLTIRFKIKETLPNYYPTYYA